MGKAENYKIIGNYIANGGISEKPYNMEEFNATNLIKQQWLAVGSDGTLHGNAVVSTQRASLSNTYDILMKHVEHYKNNVHPLESPVLIIIEEFKV